MNVPFHLLPLETKVQVIIAYVDMALVSVGRFIQVAMPLAAVVLLAAMIVFLFYSKRSRRRVLR